MKFQEIQESCWKGYRQAGMKKKGDRMVPNCVPVEEGEMSAERNTAKSLARDLKNWIEDYQEIQAAGLDSSNIGYIRKLKRNIETAHEQIRRLGYRFDANNPDLIRLMGRALAEIKTGPEMTLNDLLYTAAAKAMHQAGLEGVPMDYEEAIKKAAKIYRIPYTPSELPKLLAQRAEIDRKLAMLKQGKQIAKARRQEKLAPTPAGAEEYWKTHALPTDRIKPPAKTLEETEADLAEDLKKWFKEKWVRFGPDGKIRGSCARGSESEGKPKCLPQAKAHALGKKGRASAAAKKRREDPNPERRGKAKNVATRVKEGSLNEYRDRMYQYIKSIVPGFPDYVVKDWLYANFARGATQGPGWSFDTIGKDIPKILADMGLNVNTRWQLVPNMKFTMDMWEPKTLKRLQARAGGSSKSTDPDVHIPARDAERHATQAQLAQQQGGVRKEPVILIKTSKGYELLEGWHRTIQHFAKYPDGYTGPAYVAVAQGQQGVAEGNNDDWDDADEFGMPGSEFFPDEDDRLRDGDYVRDRQDGEHGEIFRMSGDPSERRVRILDRDGRGWYISPERLVAVDRTDPDIMKYFGKRRHRDMDEATGDSRFDQMMGRIVDPVAALKQDRVYEEQLEDYVFEFMNEFLTRMDQLGIEVWRDNPRAGEDLTNPKFAQAYEQASLKAVQKFMQRKKLDTNNRQLVAQVKADFDENADQVNPVAGFLGTFMQGFTTLRPGEIDIMAKAGMFKKPGQQELDEKQDACYRKVKSRYKVWPSAYASGALVQCRKKGAANWGTGGKKK